MGVIQTEPGSVTHLPQAALDAGGRPYLVPKKRPSSSRERIKEKQMAHLVQEGDNSGTWHLGEVLKIDIVYYFNPK